MFLQPNIRIVHSKTWRLFYNSEEKFSEKK